MMETTALVGSGSVPAPLGLLLLEDSPTDSRLLVESLREAVSAGQVAVQTVRRLADALRELKRFSFSCVLVDLGLPDGEGVAHVQRIRDADTGVAIVVLTGLEDERAARQAFELGAHDYLVKGRYWGEELLQVVRRAVARANQRPGAVTDAGAEAVRAAGNAADEPALRLQPWVDISRNRLSGVHAVVEAGFSSGDAIKALLAGWTALHAGGADFGTLSLSLRALPEAEIGILECLPAWLDAAGTAPGALRLRVTVETLLRRTAALPALVRLRSEGVAIVVDAWRPGAAPLDALSHMPLDGLVLDPSVGRALIDPAAEITERFVRATLAASAALGMEVLAEGVAMAEQHSRLAALGCRRLRGDWYCAAEAPADLAARWRKGPWGLDRRAY